MLKEGVTHAQGQGFRRIFVDEGERMRDLLEVFRLLFPQAQLSEFVAEILSIYPDKPVFDPKHSIL